MRTRAVFTIFFLVVMFMGAVSAVAQPQDFSVDQPTIGLAAPITMPDNPVTVPTGECAGFTVEPWPAMPADGWLDETSEEQSTGIGGPSVPVSRHHERVFQTMWDLFDGLSGELQQFEDVVCTTDLNGQPSGWVVESVRARIENAKGEVLRYSLRQLVGEQSLYNYALIGERGSYTTDGIESVWAEAGHRTEAVVAMPSGRTVWILAQGVNSPSYAGFPTTFPPPPDQGEPEEIWLRGKVLPDVALEIAAATACGTAPSGVNVVTGDAWLLNGTNHRDYLCSDGGESMQRGFGGNDILKGGAGDNWLLGGRGRDRISGQGGDDMLIGGAGKDRLRGGGGTDTCSMEKPARRSCENNR